MLYLLGVSHRSAPVEVRERLHFRPEEIRESLSELCRSEGIHEAMLLSTCNRTEILVSGGTREQAATAVAGLIAHRREEVAASLDRNAYRLEDHEAAKHIFRVASSLDSMIVGEPQILGQVKESYAMASGEGAVGPVLSAVMQRAFACAKKVRTETGISRRPVSVAYAAAELARQIFGSLEGRAILVLGAGKMGKLTARHLAGKGVRKILVASRTFDHARHTAGELGGEAIAYDDFIDHVSEIDVLIASTAAPHHVLRREDGVRIMKARRHRPVFMVDLAVPRNLDPALNDLDNLFLYNIDALQDVADEGKEERSREAEAAEELIQREFESYQRWVRSLSVQPTIVDLRNHFQQIADDELEKQKSRLARLEPQQARAVAGLLHSVLNKLLHSPTVILRKAHEESDGSDLVAHARRLFGLGDAEPGETTETGGGSAGAAGSEGGGSADPAEAAGGPAPEPRASDEADPSPESRSGAGPSRAVRP